MNSSLYEYEYQWLSTTNRKSHARFRLVTYQNHRPWMTVNGQYALYCRSDTVTENCIFFICPIPLIRRPLSGCLFLEVMTKMESWGHPFSEDRIIVAWVFSTQYQRVTDRRKDTDGQIYYNSYSVTLTVFDALSQSNLSVYPHTISRN